MRLSSKDKKRIVITVTLIVAVLLLLLFVFKDNKDHNNHEEEYVIEDESIEYNGKKYVPKSGLSTVVVMGTDAFEEDNGSRMADFVFTVVFDPNENSTKLIAINRDSMVEVDELNFNGEIYGSDVKQLSYAYGYGTGGEDSARNVRNSIRKLFDIKNIDLFVALTMDAVGIVNDAVGGIEIDGELLMGPRALEYVRARQSLESGSNIERMQRQNVYLSKLIDKIKEKAIEDDAFLKNEISDLIQYTVSNLSVNQLSDLANSVLNSEIEPIYVIDGEEVKGQEHREFYINENSLKKILVECFYEPARD